MSRPSDAELVKFLREHHHQVVGRGLLLTPQCALCRVAWPCAAITAANALEAASVESFESFAPASRVGGMSAAPPMGGCSQVNQRCLFWLGDGPETHRTTFRPTDGDANLTVLARDGRIALLVIDNERLAQELWAALRLTFPSLNGAVDHNQAPVNDA